MLFYRREWRPRGERPPYFLADADFMAEDSMVYDLDFVVSKGYAVIAISCTPGQGWRAIAPYDIPSSRALREHPVDPWPFRMRPTLAPQPAGVFLFEVFALPLRSNP